MNRINLNKLYYFYIVAKEGSIKDACSKLFLAQPTVSVQIKSLEEEIGFKLFTREHKRLRLTEQGSHLLSRAEKLFLMADDIVAELPQMGTRSRERFRIGTISSLSSAFINDFSLDLWADKSISTSIVPGNYESLREALDQNKIDIVLSDDSFGNSSKYKSVRLGGDRLLAVAAKSYKRYVKDFPRSLHRLPYISFLNEVRTQSEINYFFNRESIRPEVVGMVDDMSLLRMIAQQGIGFTILPYRAVKDSLVNGSLIQLGELSQVVFSLYGILPASSVNRSLIKKVISQYFKRS